MIEMLNQKTHVHVFIPGKNWKLSLAELVSFLKAREYNFRIIEVSKSFFIFETSQPLNSSIIQELGGTIKIAQVVSVAARETLEEAFLHRQKQVLAQFKTSLATADVNDMFPISEKKTTFGVSLYFEDMRFLAASMKIHRYIGSYFKKQLSSQGRKANFMGFPRDRKLPQLTHVEVIKKNLLEESAEILLCIGKTHVVLSKTVGVHDPFEFQKRDMQRPMQRKIFSIPPRLARIMINLASCSAGKVFLDPFCGVGTILQEALLMNAQAIGMDINPWCVKASEANLDWLTKEYGLETAKCKIILGDSRNLTGKIEEETVDCIATEPDLGPALRHFPTERYAEKLVERQKPLYYSFLDQAWKALRSHGRLVLVTPYVKTRANKFIRLSLKEKVKAVGFERICFFEKKIFEEKSSLAENLLGTSSFVDITERHKIGREIHVFRKPSQ